MFSSSVFTGYTKSVLRAGVRTLSTGFFGYHSFMAPVRRSNVLSVVGQTIQPSYVKTGPVKVISFSVNLK